MEYYSVIEKEIFTEVEKIADGTDITVNLIHVTKNNGIEQNGISFHKAGMNCGPTVYFGTDEERITEGDLTVAEAAEEMMDAANSHMYAEVQIDFENWDEIKSKLLVTLVSESRNDLTGVPHRHIAGDIAVTCRLVIEIEDGIGSVKITDQMLKGWGISEDELFEQANISSAENYPVTVATMEEILFRKMNLSEEYVRENFGMTMSEFRQACAMGGSGMIVITNSMLEYGASAIIYSDALKQLAREYESDLYILPSSISEVIVIPYIDVEEDAEERLSGMIGGVNATQVPDAEILSDLLYKYERKTDRIVAVNKA